MKPQASLLVPNPGISRLPHLGAFLPEYGKLVRSPVSVMRPGAVAGWGYGRYSAYARHLAEFWGSAYLALEDGFLRSVGTGRHGAAPMSLVADRTGIYYDSRSGSELETLIASGSGDSAVRSGLAGELLALKQKLRLSKYNAGVAPSPDECGPKARGRILVIDQVSGDASIAGAGATGDTFAAMVRAARAENPHATLLIKRHPAARSGRAAIPAGSIQSSDVVIDRDINLIDLIGWADRVYTVSSLAGFEALLCGKPVTCFGLPFYAGWGLTDDRLSSLWRTARPDLASLFAAAYLSYARYVDPVDGRRIDARAAMLRLAGFRDHANRVRGRWVALDIAPPKRSVLRAFLESPVSTVRFESEQRFRGRGPPPGVQIARWASRMPDEAAQEQAGTIRIEDGFLRSAGLGSSFYPAASLVFDRCGIHYDHRSASDLETILTSTEFDDALLAESARLRTDILSRNLTKYNLKVSGRLDVSKAGDRKVVFVPGQVEDDASVRTGGFGLTNLELLRRVRADEPDAFIVFKQHPDVVAGNRIGAVSPADALGCADLLAPDADILNCISVADEVHTLTSLTGFEALLRGKAVTVHGVPFYAGWGLTRDLFPEGAAAQRNRKLSLDELVAGALILYPMYIDPLSGLPVSAAAFPARLDAARQALTSTGLGPGRWTPVRRFVRAVGETLHLRKRRSY